MSVVLLVAAAGAGRGSAVTKGLPGRAPALHKDILVGIHYFSGWWPEQPNKWTLNGQDWRLEYPGRVPLLGAFNGQATMDREIEAASRYGVDYFQILWYYNDPKVAKEPHADQLNNGLRCFMASRNSSLMAFTIEVVNHAPFDIPTDDAWDASCREWVRCMKHPSYLRVGGRPVIKIHGLEWFLRQNDGDNRKVAAKLEHLRQVAREAGVPSPLISVGVGAGGVASGPPVEPYDFMATYMDVPPLDQRAEPYPYAKLIDWAEAGWRRYAASADRPYVPYVPAGWDPRPWHDPRPSFEMPTAREWRDALERVRRALAGSPKLGIPLPDGSTRKSLLIYSWNEFGEGGIVAPTKGPRYRMLEGIRAVFGPRPKRGGAM
ncbi:MAG TPA: hypothetical protein VGN26_11190 [Armatimonadota bacterium]